MCATPNPTYDERLADLLCVPHLDVSMRVFERSKGIYPDETDLALYAERLARWLAIPADRPRVGDFLLVSESTTQPLFKRFTHAWNDGIQTTSETRCPNSPDDWSFYIAPDASVSYSGGLDAAIPYDRLVIVSESRARMGYHTGDMIIDRTPMLVPGTFWFFKHDRPGASRGLSCTLPCRVWRDTALACPVARRGGGGL
jgi:hypothetical protein